MADSSSPAVGASTSPNGRFVVVWAEETGSESPPTFHGRLFDHQGAPVGDEILIAGDEAIYRGPCDVAVSPAGEFVVTWLTGERLDNDVAARSFDATGAPRAASFAPGTDETAIGRGYPSVAAESSSGFVVVWGSRNLSSNGYLGANTHIATRRLDAMGVPIGTETIVASGQVPDAVDAGFRAVRAPDIATAGRGEFVVAWVSLYDSYWYGDFSNIARSRRRFRDDAPLSSARSTIGGEGERFEQRPRVAGDLFGNTAVVWTASSGCSSGSADYGEPEGCHFRYDGIGLERVDADGRTLPATSPVNVFNNDGQHQGDVGMSPAGDFVVVWNSGATPESEKSDNTAPPQDGAESGIFLRGFDCAGNALSDVDIQVNEWTTGAQHSPRVAVSASGHVLVTWEDDANTAVSARVFRFDPPCPLCGDADASGEIRATDALMALQTAIGLFDCAVRRCDVNADGQVSAADALALLAWAAGLETKLRCDHALPEHKDARRSA